jgi:hypothetical protein
VNLHDPDRHDELPVAKIIPLRPRAPASVPEEPRSLRHVVEACVAHLDANASLDELVAEVRSLVGPDVYETWTRLAFRDLVASVVEARR